MSRHLGQRGECVEVEGAVVNRSSAGKLEWLTAIGFNVRVESAARVFDDHAPREGGIVEKERERGDLCIVPGAVVVLLRALIASMLALEQPVEVGAHPLAQRIMLALCPPGRALQQPQR